MNPYLITAGASIVLSVVAVNAWFWNDARIACEICMTTRRRRVIETFCLDCDNSRIFRVCNDCEPDPEDSCEEYHTVGMTIGLK